MKKLKRYSLILSLIFVIGFGSSRLYFLLTDGFCMRNITHNLPFDPRFATHPLTLQEKEEVLSILNQPFSYLGKGCQSYVFLSADGEYVVKFFKFQRYRKSIIDHFDFIPFIKRARMDRLAHKKQKLENLFLSWKVAFDHLAEETEILYVHLNRTEDLKQKLTFTDKLGFAHVVDLDKMEFMLQKKAKMICPCIEGLMQEGKKEEAKQILYRLFDLIVSEYQRGFADNDQALMQNTGVVDGKPFHVDIGQFVFNENMKSPWVYAQHLYNKMYKFGLWLEERYPELAEVQQAKLHEIVGPQLEHLVYHEMGES